MPKNTKGGNKAKSLKNSTGIEKKREIPIGEKEDDSHIGVIHKVLGDGRYISKKVTANGTEDKEYLCNLSIGTKRRYCRGIILKVGSYILFSIREFQKEKADILFAYKDSELTYLSDNKLITLIQTNDDNDLSSADNFVFSNFDSKEELDVDDI